MHIRWTTPAYEDLDRIAAFLVGEHPAVAGDILNAITQRVAELSTFPELGRPGETSGTRELVVTRFPYVVVYQLAADSVEVLHVWHGSQDWR